MTMWRLTGNPAQFEFAEWPCSALFDQAWRERERSRRGDDGGTDWMLVPF
jgi:hypothetical protein